MLEKYYFICKSSQGYWNTATNPRFIAEHQYCKVVPKTGVFSISEFLWKINNCNRSELPKDILEIIEEFNIN